MEFRLGPWPLALGLIGTCGLVLAGIWWYKSAAPQPLSALVEHMPPAAGIIVGVDVRALREHGILDRLAGPGALEQPDYRNFVEQTAFNYRTDLDYVVLGLSQSANYYLARGRFHWSSVLQYAQHNGGSCNFAFCRIATESGREMAYFPHRSDVLAMAVSDESWIADQLQRQEHRRQKIDCPSVPVWILAQKQVIEKPALGPSGMVPLLTLFRGAEQAMLTMDFRDASLDLRLQANCPSPAMARVLLDRLSTALRHLNEAAPNEPGLDREPTLASALAAAKLSVKDNQVQAAWTADSKILDELTRAN